MIVGDCKPTFNGQRYNSVEEAKLAILAAQGDITRASRGMDSYLTEEEAVADIPEEVQVPKIVEDEVTIESYKKEDLLYDPVLTNSLLAQIPELAEVSERA